VSIVASEGYRWRVFVAALVPVLAAMAAWLSGFIETSSMEYGFPLPWRTLVLGAWNCPRGPILSVCILELGPVYNWSFFALDTLFYVALGCAFIVSSAAVIGKSGPWRTLHPPSRDPAQHCAFA